MRQLTLTLNPHSEGERLIVYECAKSLSVIHGPKMTACTLRCFYITRRTFSEDQMNIMRVRMRLHDAGCPRVAADHRAAGRGAVTLTVPELNDLRTKKLFVHDVYEHDISLCTKYTTVQK